MVRKGVAVYRRTLRTKRSGFDQAALSVTRAMRRRGHSITGIRRGPNRRVFKQCDPKGPDKPPGPEMVKWNGRQYQIKLD